MGIEYCTFIIPFDKVIATWEYSVYLYGWFLYQLSKITIGKYYIPLIAFNNLKHIYWNIYNGYSCCSLSKYNSYYYFMCHCRRNCCDDISLEVPLGEDFIDDNDDTEEALQQHTTLHEKQERVFCTRFCIILYRR